MLERGGEAALKASGLARTSAKKPERDMHAAALSQGPEQVLPSAKP